MALQNTRMKYMLTSIPIDIYTCRYHHELTQYHLISSYGYEKSLENVLEMIRPKDLYRPNATEVRFRYILIQTLPRTILFNMTYNYASESGYEHVKNLMLQAIYKSRNEL